MSHAMGQTSATGWGWCRAAAFCARPGASACSTPDARVEDPRPARRQPGLPKTVIALAGWQLPTGWHGSHDQLAIS